MVTDATLSTSTTRCAVHHGDCRDILPTIGDASVDAIITDPPYELGFMGKRWDATGIAYDPTVWAECLRVLKPGGHLLAFGGTRTYHRMACAIEDAGFEIRDSIHWLYGSGFPKSLDVSKAIDKAAGAEREVVGEGPYSARRPRMDVSAVNAYSDGVGDYGSSLITAPATDAAKQWSGWGTALKPAHEPIIVARKPLDGTVAANVLAYGTGALNIGGCRIPMPDADRDKINNMRGFGRKGWTRSDGTLGSIYKGTLDGSLAAIDAHAHDLGRWPANVVIDQHIAEQHPEWANYYYCPKASTAERNTGLDGLPERKAGSLNMRTDSHSERNNATTKPAANHHPTVKPLNLMRWLCRLVTPPDGTILDPFAGSGTTLTAAILEHFNTIGIELTDDYVPVIDARIRWAEAQPRQLRIDL